MLGISNSSIVVEGVPLANVTLIVSAALVAAVQTNPAVEGAANVGLPFALMLPQFDPLALSIAIVALLTNTMATSLSPLVTLLVNAHVATWEPFGVTLGQFFFCTHGLANAPPAVVSQSTAVCACAIAGNASISNAASRIRILFMSGSP